jgi:3alpha(or 20beta)-hydroxysteroid dehydrogenase
MNRLASKVALVTGGSRGIGAAVVEAIHAEGGSVVFGDVLREEGLALEQRLGSERAVFVDLDVTDGAAWEAAINLAVERFGALNVLVNNAGISNFGSIEDYTVEQWDLIQDINLKGPFLGIKAAVSHLKSSAPSSIINVSSAAGLRGFPATHGYTASKFGIRGLTKSVAGELGIFDVRANSVHPGSIRTPMLADVDEDSASGALGRAGEASEVANLIVFLASDEASYISGDEFSVDGGLVNTYGNVLR